MSVSQTTFFYSGLFFLTAFLPGLLWMGYFFYKAQIDRSHFRFILAIFIVAMMPVIPAGILEDRLIAYLQGHFPSHTMSYQLIMLFLIVGPVEEFVKFYVVYLFIYRYHGFDEPMDGIVYASASALGFASLENLFYMLDYGWTVILIRGPLSTLGHVLFASYWGVAMGSAYFQESGQRGVILIKGLLVAIFMHGLFNFLILAFPILALIFLMPLMIFMWRYLHRKIDDAIVYQQNKRLPKQGIPRYNPYDFHNRHEEHY